MVGEWFVIEELQQKVKELERDLKETKQTLSDTRQELDDIRFTLDWERRLATDNSFQEALEMVRDCGEEAERSLAHAFRLTRDPRSLSRIAQRILRDVEKKRFRPFDPVSVRRDLEESVSKPKHKGRVRDVDLGWEWNKQDFWTERDARKARQAYIDEAVAARTGKLPF